MNDKYVDYFEPPYEDAVKSDVDPFSDENLVDPHSVQGAIREAAPFVWLTRYGVWATARHKEVHAVFSDWETFSSARGVGLTDYKYNKPFRKPSLVLESDPPDHTRAKRILTRVLSPAVLRDFKPVFEKFAVELVDRVLKKQEVQKIDGYSELAEPFPLKLFPDAVGLEANGRKNLLEYGAIVFNSVGPCNAAFERAMKNADRVIPWITEHCDREHLSPGGLGDKIYSAIDTGEITAEEAPTLVRSFLTAGVDTTINGIAVTLLALAQNPNQWKLLRDDPSLARSAFEETLRYMSPAHSFFRTTSKESSMSGVRLGADQKVLLMMAGANRDPRKWDDPDSFIIKRDSRGHVAFGTGIHGCVGQMISRLEAEVLIAELARRVESMNLAGDPVMIPNNSLRIMGSLPLSIETK